MIIVALFGGASLVLAALIFSGHIRSAFAGAGQLLRLVLLVDVWFSDHTIIPAKADPVSANLAGAVAEVLTNVKATIPIRQTRLALAGQVDLSDAGKVTYAARSSSHRSFSNDDEGNCHRSQQSRPCERDWRR